MSMYNVAHTPILNGASFIGERTSCFLSPAMAEGNSLASHTLTHERGSGQAAIVELC